MKIWTSEVFEKLEWNTYAHIHTHTHTHTHTHVYCILENFKRTYWSYETSWWHYRVLKMVGLFFLLLSVKDHLLWELWFRQALSVFLGSVPTPGMIPSLRKRCPFFWFTMVFFHLAVLEICKHKKGTRWSVSSVCRSPSDVYLRLDAYSICLSDLLFNIELNGIHRF